MKTLFYIYVGAYVDDSTIFEICNNTSVSVLQQLTTIIATLSTENDMRINAMQMKEIVISFCRGKTNRACLSCINKDRNAISGRYTVRCNRAGIAASVSSYSDIEP